jgi:hypothetical protein
LKKTKDIKQEGINDEKKLYGRNEKEKLYVKVTAKHVRKQSLLTKAVALIVITLLSTLSLVYGVLYIVNETGNFTINLDPNLQATKNIVISNYKDFHETSLLLVADKLEYMDNISGSWYRKI